MESICQNQNLVDAMATDINTHNQNFGKWEQIKKFELTPNAWSF